MKNKETKKIQRRVNNIIRNRRLGFFVAKFEKVSNQHRCWTGEITPGIAFLNLFTGRETTTISLKRIKSPRKIVELWLAQ
jgi:hypothetical protein